jgi:MFS family permease
VALLSDGIICIVATPLGGWLSDKFAAQSKAPVSRVALNTWVVLALGPAGNISAAWALHYKVHMAFVLVTVCVAGFGAFFYVPALFSYMSTVRQSTPAVATAGVQSIMAVCAGAVVVAGAVARNWLGYGWWLTALALLQLSVGVFAGVVIYRQQAKAVLLPVVQQRGAVVDTDIDIDAPAEAPSGELKPQTGCASAV